MSSAPTPDEIWQDACWLAQAVDPRAGLVRFVEMDAEDYRQASFLDDRMLDETKRSHLVPWADVANARPGGARNDARWIFHIGHVGSTLVSRLLGELPSVLAVREPRALRDLTFFPRDVRDRFALTLRALMSRTFSPEQRALVKATSFVSEIAAELVAPTSPALFLYATPQSYIAGVLAGENSRKELSGMADMRRQRLAARGIALPPPANEAHSAATAWACEMTALEAAAETLDVRWADFDRMLENVEGALANFSDFLGFKASHGQLAEIARGRLMMRYSKATEHEYSPALRRQLLDEAAARHRTEIESALAMLDRASETAPLLRRALDRARRQAGPES